MSIAPATPSTTAPMDPVLSKLLEYVQSRSKIDEALQSIPGVRTNARTNPQLTEILSTLDAMQEKTRERSIIFFQRLQRGEDVDSLELWDKGAALTKATEKAKELHFFILKKIALGKFSVQGKKIDALNVIKEIFRDRIALLNGLAAEVKSIQEQRKLQVTDGETAQTENPCFEKVLQLIEQEDSYWQQSLESITQAIQQAFSPQKNN